MSEYASLVGGIVMVILATALFLFTNPTGHFREFEKYCTTYCLHSGYNCTQNCIPGQFCPLNITMMCADLQCSMCNQGGFILSLVPGFILSGMFLIGCAVIYSSMCMLRDNSNKYKGGQNR